MSNDAQRAFAAAHTVGDARELLFSVLSAEMTGALLPVHRNSKKVRFNPGVRMQFDERSSRHPETSWSFK
jgi:hypothetical protein